MYILLVADVKFACYNSVNVCSEQTIVYEGTNPCPRGTGIKQKISNIYLNMEHHLTIYRTTKIQIRK